MVFPNGFNSVTPILGHTSDSLEELVKNRDTQLPPPPSYQPSVPWVSWGHHCFKENPSGDWIVLEWQPPLWTSAPNPCLKACVASGVDSKLLGLNLTVWNQVQEQTTCLKSQLSSFILYTTPMGLSFPWGVPVTWGRIFHVLCHTALHFSELPETFGRSSGPARISTVKMAVASISLLPMDHQTPGVRC